VWFSVSLLIFEVYAHEGKLLYLFWITPKLSCLQPERAGRRHSIGSRAGSQPPESQLGMNRQDYFVLEDLVQRRHTEAMKSQGLELVRLLRVSTARRAQWHLIQKAYSCRHKLNGLGSINFD